jgi:3',5'-cyclic AMP phosphodiesterase CpdA
MTRIAHLSDLHVVERDHARRGVAERVRLRYLSFGRAIDAEGRLARVERALRQAWAARPDHVCITGDLTEDGTDAQFEALAEVLERAEIPPERTTLVPGNHDGYAALDAFDRALDGPLRAYRGTSRPGAVVEYEGAAVVAVSTLIDQPYTRSAGAVCGAQRARIDAVARARSLGDRAVVVAQHHPPMRHLPPGLQWIDGLDAPASMTALVERHAHLHVLHGHTHTAWDRAVGRRREPQAFCVAAVVEDEAPVRVYEAARRRLRPLDRTPTPAPAAAAREGFGRPGLGLAAPVTA